MVKVYIDASTKQQPLSSACGVVIKDENQIETGKYLGAIDNHVAEWESLIFAMEYLIAHQFKQAIIYTDSKIVADSIDKLYVKSKQFQPYLDIYVKLNKQFDLIFVSWIPRSENKHADQIARRYLK